MGDPSLLMQRSRSSQRILDFNPSVLTLQIQSIVFINLLYSTTSSRSLAISLSRRSYRDLFPSHSNCIMSEAGPQIARDAVIVVVNMVDPVRSAIRKAHWLFPESHANDASLRVKWLKYPEWEIYLDEQCSYSSQKHFLRALIRGAYQYIHCEREWLSSMELLGEVSEMKYEFEIVSRRGKNTYIR